MYKKGFTLIELLIVIAIIAILAGVVFVSLDPLKRFQDARNASRWTDVTAVLSAIKVNQVDNGGGYFTDLTDAFGATNLIISGDVTPQAGWSGCNPIACSAATSSAACVSLKELVDNGVLGRIPVSPNAAGSDWNTVLTGYYLSKNANGSITVGACDAEGGETIEVNR
jgi:prepilin-type N-terminal cleavage/methylation domain-containing protein